MFKLDVFLNSFCGADLVLHFVVGLTVSAMSMLLFKTKWIGTFFTLVLAISKELWDFNNNGEFVNGSFLDAFITVYGALIARMIINKYFERNIN